MDKLLNTQRLGVRRTQSTTVAAQKLSRHTDWLVIHGVILVEGLVTA